MTERPQQQAGDPMLVNRAQNPRRTPGREEVGAATTRRLFFVIVIAVVVATAVLVGVLIGR